MFHGNGVTIDVDGSVLPCTHFAGMPLFSLLDNAERVISPAAFELAWNDAGGRFRERLWVYPADECESCPAWQKCYGGCPLFWTRYDPKIAIRGCQ